MTEPRTDLIDLPALGPNGAYRALNRATVGDVSGTPVAEISLVPSLFVQRSLTAARRAAGLPVEERIDLIARAGLLFATGELGGQTVAEYEHAVSRVGGIPAPVVRTTTAAIALRLAELDRGIQLARPRGDAGDWRTVPTHAGNGVWTRRGNVFAVLAAGNHPGPHSLWPEALALGYRVVIRPSRREPFTPYRLVLALREVGFGPDLVQYLPTDHERADHLVAGADLGLVYGGEDVVRKYATDPSVLLQGPGRSKILLTRDSDWREHLETIVESVSHHGGTGCVNTTAVFVDGDPGPLCQALAERFAALPSLPPEDEKAVLPVQPAASARAIAAFLERRAIGTRPWLGGADVVHELGDGSAVLRPAVHQLDRPDAPQAGIELPFPCVWVAPWTPEAGIAPLRDSLVLTAITRDAELVDRLLDEPGIRNLYLGDQHTYRMEPGLPHDGYLSEFLMRSKSVVRDEHGPAPVPRAETRPR